MIQTETSDSFALDKHAAKLGPNHGYRIEGDTALLHADISLDIDPDRQAQWALQLWACDSPFDGGALSGLKIAEAPLPLPERTAEPKRMDAETFAVVPGGERDYSMVLVLASGAPGAFTQIHDFANYPARERFIAPHLEGSVGYHIDGDSVTLRAERIRNPRAEGNISGSLILELWALPTPYTGGNGFDGKRLAHADLGRIAGGEALQAEQHVTFSPPSFGEWNVVLMLREWVAGGYVTRDSCTFSELYRVAEAAPEPIPEPIPEPTLELPAAPQVTNGAVVYFDRDVSATTPGSIATPLARAIDGRVSIMHASVEDLARVKGLTRKIAVEIVKGRPYTSLDELVRVRGIGPKLLVKLRPYLTR